MGTSSEELSSFIDSVCTQSRLRVEKDLGSGFVRLRSDEAERRQAVHDIRSSEDIVIELLRNARDAGARHIFLATTRSGDTRTIVAIDDGEGIPVTHHELVFEPRVTSKLDTVHIDKWGVHGRGMALYSIAVNSDIAKVASSAKGRGAALFVSADMTHLSEKRDQSSFPNIVIEEGGRAVIRGPHNIIRTTVEFALEHRSSLQVYLGSPAEIAAAIYEYGMSVVSSSARAFDRDLDRVSLIKTLCYATGDEELASLCKDIGLDISTRTARRIMDGEIASSDDLVSLIEQSLLAGQQNAQSSKEGEGTRRLALKKTIAANPRLRLTRDELDPMRESARKAYKDIAESYYLDPEVDIDVKIVNGSLRISIPIVELT